MSRKTSRWSSTNAGNSAQPESDTRQVIYFVLVSSCSVTVGMCLEWTWCVTDEWGAAVDPDECRSQKFQSRMCFNVLYFGMVVSAGLVAFLASHVGHKALLIIGTVITTFGSIAVIGLTSGPMTMVYYGRLLQGIFAGFVFVIVPNYAARIAATGRRGALTSLHYAYLLIGMLLSHITGSFYSNYFVDLEIVTMSILNFVVLLAVDDLQYYRPKFSRKRDCTLCDNILKIKDCENVNAWNHFCTNLKNDTSGQTENGVTMAMILTEKTVWQPLLVNVCLISVQQLSGFDSLTSKLRLTFYGKLPAAIGAQIPFTAAVISFQFCGAIICLILVGVIERKYLLTISGLGMAIVLTLLNIGCETDDDKLWLIIFIVIYMFFHSIGYGPLPWILMPEICPRKSRLWTSGVTVSLYAILNIFKNQSVFDSSFTVYGKNVFLFMYIVVCLFGAYFAYVYVPEKKSCIML